MGLVSLDLGLGGHAGPHVSFGSLSPHFPFPVFILASFSDLVLPFSPSPFSLSLQSCVKMSHASAFHWTLNSWSEDPSTPIISSLPSSPTTGKSQATGLLCGLFVQVSWLMRVLFCWLVLLNRQKPLPGQGIHPMRFYIPVVWGETGLCHVSAVLRPPSRALFVQTCSMWGAGRAKLMGVAVHLGCMGSEDEAGQLGSPSSSQGGHRIACRTLMRPWHPVWPAWHQTHCVNS